MMRSLFRFNGSLSDLANEILLDREQISLRDDQATLVSKVRRIVTEVAQSGDTALQAICKDVDGVMAQEVPPSELLRARATIAPSVERALTRLLNNLRRVSEAQLPSAGRVQVEPGLSVQRTSEPLARVGVYAPGGSAAYASSVLMGVVPASVAGVPEIIVCSPPGANGLPSSFVLGAAQMAGATRVFSVGGAQAIAAMAYGTQLIPRVQRIVGPGNAWVAEAKRQVSGRVAIDSPAGPSELLLIASEEGNAQRIAAEMLAQAEHDEAAVVVAIVHSERLRSEVQNELELAMTRLPRARIVREALARRGALLVAAELDRALAFANAFAAEHVLLSGRAAEALAAEVRCSGTVYVGAGASVAFGDYLTGCNHVLPTAAAARFASGLSVSDFLRFSSIQSVSASAAASLSADAQCLASEEGLDGHAEAARLAGLQASAATQPVARLEKLARVTAAPNAAVDLSDNTNRFGVPPSLARQSAVDVSRYPTPYADALRQRLAERFATTVDHVVTGCGSDDVIASTIAALTSPGEALAMMRPCFSMVEQFAEIQSLRIVDLTQVERASLVYLGAPNNPTGTDVSWAFVESILARTQGVVLLDEAYVEYCGRESFASKALAHQRVVVTRTFSKAWGMAGLRVGYGIACPQLIAQIEKARGPYKVSKQSEAAVCLALEQDTAWVNAIAAQTVKLREDLISDLRELGLAPLPSRANFVLVPVSENAVQLSQRLTRLGVSVRPFADLPELGDALRITVGPRSDLDALLRAWRSL